MNRSVVHDDVLLAPAVAFKRALGTIDVFREGLDRHGVVVPRVTTARSFVNDAIGYFHGRHTADVPNELDLSHHTYSPTRSAHDAAERDRLTQIKVPAQPNVAADVAAFVGLGGCASPSVASQHAGAI